MDVHVLRVFTDPNGQQGNPLGVVLDAARLSDARRQQIATDLGFSETVFVIDSETARLRIHTPACELPMAGHPLVGASWLLGQLTDTPPTTLRPELSGPVRTWTTAGVTWISARPEDAPPWEFVERDTPEEVLALPTPAAEEKTHRCVWAWEDPANALVRCRVFGSAFGVVEDEATGSAALRLTALLERPIIIHQGRGSVIFARPTQDGWAEVGGSVVLDEIRAI